MNKDYITVFYDFLSAASTSAAGAYCKFISRPFSRKINQTSNSLTAVNNRMLHKIPHIMLVGHFYNNIFITGFPQKFTGSPYCFNHCRSVVEQMLLRLIEKTHNHQHSQFIACIKDAYQTRLCCLVHMSSVLGETACINYTPVLISVNWSSSLQAHRNCPDTCIIPFL